MTGNEIAKSLGKVKVPLYGGITGEGDVYYIALQKSDLKEVMGQIGERETGLTLRETSGAWYLDRL